jgi:hypothetical protein
LNANVLQKIKHLNLKCCALLTVDSIKHISTIKGLQTLTLQTSADDTFIATLTEALRENQISLQKLDVSHCVNIRETSMPYLTALNLPELLLPNHLCPPIPEPNLVNAATPPPPAQEQASGPADDDNASEEPASLNNPSDFASIPCSLL